MSEVTVLVNNHPVIFEIAPEYGSESTSARGNHAQVGNAFEQAKGTIFSVCSSMIESVQALDRAVTPDEFSLEFGIKFKVDGTVVVASVSSEATLTVKLVYQHREK